MGSGNKYFGSEITSNFTKLLSTCPMRFVNSRPKQAKRIASSAVLAPAVLGNNHSLLQSSEVMKLDFCDKLFKSKRRIATVTISHSLKKMLSCVLNKLLYLPVPKINRELNSLL